MSLLYEKIGACLVESVPESKPLLDKHIAEYGELLPHVLFGELAQWIVELFKRWQQTKDAGAYETFAKIVQFVQSCMNSEDERVQELVLFSFLENLWQAGHNYENIRQHLGHELQHWLDRIEKWWSSEEGR